ncbi:Helicase MOV-10, partial [Desmophyllum pertusum]
RTTASSSEDCCQDRHALPPYLVFGPPGTGKDCYCEEAIKQVGLSRVSPRSFHAHFHRRGRATQQNPSAIIPVADLLDPNNPRGGQMVHLAGDPKQLGPILQVTKSHRNMALVQKIPKMIEIRGRFGPRIKVEQRGRVSWDKRDRIIILSTVRQHQERIPGDGQGLPPGIS